MENILNALNPAQLGIGMLSHNDGIKISPYYVDGFEWTRIEKLPTGGYDSYYSLLNADKDPTFSSVKYSAWRFVLTTIFSDPGSLNIRLDLIGDDDFYKQVLIDNLFVPNHKEVTVSTIIPPLDTILTAKEMLKFNVINIVLGTDTSAPINIRNPQLTRIKRKSYGINNTVVYDSDFATQGSYDWNSNEGVATSVATWPARMVATNTDKRQPLDVFTSVPKNVFATGDFETSPLNVHVTMRSQDAMRVVLHADFFKNGQLVKSTTLRSVNLNAGVRFSAEIPMREISTLIGDLDAYEVVNFAFAVPAGKTLEILEFKVTRRTIIDGSGGLSETLPTVELSGSMPQSSSEKTTNSFTYTDGGLVISGFTKTSWQGQSSLSLAKKSFKFKPYVDAELKTKLPMQIDPKFAPASDFVLKAFYSDPTLALDNLGNEVMHDLAASRKTFSADLNKSAYLGQNYGKPVQLYCNGDYQGLYFFRSGAKEDSYGINGKDPKKFVIEGESEAGAAMFQAASVTKWGGETAEDLEAEFAANIPDELTDDQKAKFNAFVKMVNTGDLASFKAKTLDTSKEAAIDYIIFYNLMGSVDSCGRNLEWVTWDNGEHFTVIPYDFDQLFFNDYNGLGRSDTHADGFPVVQMRFGATHNKYFDLIAQAYPEELNARYAEVRKTIFKEDNMIKRINDYAQTIGAANFAKELERWPLDNRLVSYQYLHQIVYERFKLVDTQFDKFIKPLLKG